MAVAALLGASAFTGILIWTPRTGDAQAGELAMRAELRARVAALIQEKGMAWFLGTQPSAVCSYLAGASNSTVHLSAALGDVSCGGVPPPGAIHASVSFLLANRSVTVEAWSSVAA